MGSIKERKKKDGTATYYAEIRMKGSPPQFESFRTRSQAKQWIQKIETSVRDGKHQLGSAERKRTLSDLIGKFVDEVLPQFPHRVRAQTTLLRWWLERYGHLTLAEFTPAIICEGRARLAAEEGRGERKSPCTVNRYLSALGTALAAAVKEWGWLENSPMRRVTKLKESTGRDRYLTEDERKRLLIECQRSNNSNLYPIVVVALVTGMRYNEIATLNWGDVDFQQGTMKLRCTKNGDTRVVPMGQEVRTMLLQFFGNGQPSNTRVFRSSTTETNPDHRVYIRNAFENACERASIEGFRFHDLRHTAASYLAMNGATQGELMAVLGHRSPAMTKRYAHYSEAHLKRLIDRNRIGVITPATAEESASD